ncbi:MAG: hypothetical protein QM666_04870 [Acinetobacter sp.]
MKTAYSLMLCSVLLTGCIGMGQKHTSALPPIEYNQPTTLQNAATIIGNRVERPSILADTVAYVFAVDGQKVRDAEKNLSQPLTITAGQHDIQLWCQQGSAKYSNIVNVDLQAGRQYRVGYQFQPNGRNTCYMWLYDEKSLQGIGELIEGIELWSRIDPATMRPMTEYVQPVPKAMNITVPIIIQNR